MRRAILWGVEWSVSPLVCLHILLLRLFFLLCLAWCCGDHADHELTASLILPPSTGLAVKAATPSLAGLFGCCLFVLTT